MTAIHSATGLDAADLHELLECVPKDRLRKIIEKGDLGEALQAAVFGSKYHKSPKNEIIDGFAKALKVVGSQELVPALLSAWLESMPEAVETSRTILGTDNPFTTPTTAAFFEALSAIFPAHTVELLRCLAPPQPQEDAADAIPNGTVKEASESESVTSEFLPAVSDEQVTHEPEFDSVEPPDETEIEGDGEVCASAESVAESVTASLDLVDKAATSSALPRELQDCSVPDVRRLLSVPLDIFASIVGRDEWVLDHENSVSILGPKTEDRLRYLRESQHSSASPWPAPARAEYAANTARVLEEQGRWPEAQSYWLAAVRALNRSVAYAEGVLYAGLRAAGVDVGRASH